MAQVVESDPERTKRLQATRDNLQFFADNMGRLKEEHGGQYVVVYEQDVVAVAEQSEDAWEQVAEMGLEPDRCVMQYIPQPGQAFFF